MTLESRWAVRPLDVLQAINECNPRVVHFSGHGSDNDEIVFQDESGIAEPVTKEAIVQVMRAGSGSIHLVVFNTCYSSNHAEAVVGHVEAAVGMNTSIGDDAGSNLCPHSFYSAIGFGKSVNEAFEQAKAALMLEKYSRRRYARVVCRRRIGRQRIVHSQACGVGGRRKLRWTRSLGQNQGGVEFGSAP